MGKKSQDLSGRNYVRRSTPRPRAASTPFLLMAFRFYSGFTRIPLHYTSSPAPPFNPAHRDLGSSADNRGRGMSPEWSGGGRSVRSDRQKRGGAAPGPRSGAY